ncbi:Protein MEI2-like 3 [Acorus calamus]|uniref:Protein MEI2-like 3 n=1 Tax=Acorus calamus TaxID=4465 RepID=A0AAV9DX14_ACOCL|nr:Protein MEI2-like 3 [Acorus calamus]
MGDPRTTVMIRNVPNMFTTGHNLGYAFVNLTNPTATWKLCVAINGRRLDPLGSRKICEITFARIQVEVVVVLIIILS